ncbi:6-hydroxypseudooxynicotine dehydrogenase complex subunit alpha [Nocardia cerradoensis]|uniref:6-hydroxypseudooxynicotine dehydrogenase complex subunit alpha n=1 Tax=Nocardia cerradoensis TaxID=85688 RepID=A0A231HF83_9NOCA|nr:xanthine dehydrogenase family protein subunit M [Nocardia cerradoensis]OXR47347.1 6-hydroxypseudooxynicotine dehydrogenase complex subunit alpha [Nocardia cerradoensis]
MKPAAFDYHAPTSAEEAVTLLADLGDEAKIIAGGQSLVPMLALRLAVFDHLVDLRRVDDLRGIEAGASGVRIGAGTIHAAVGASDEVRRAVPLLHRATPLIGHFQIRNRGTIGGSIAHADAAAEYPVVALTLDAEIEALSPRGRRTVAAADFFTGMWTTALEPDELVTAITFPVRSGRSGYAIEEFTRRSGDFAMAGAAIAVRLDGDSRIDRCAIGLFGLAPTPVRAREAEADLLGRPADAVAAEDVGAAATANLTAISSDVHGSAEYRRRLGAAMVARAWRRAIEEASND